MATVGVSFGGMDHASGCLVAIPRASEAVTSSGTSAATTAASAAGEYIAITSTGDVWATIAASPTAAAGTTYLIPAGDTLIFKDAAGGNKVAAIDA